MQTSFSGLARRWIALLLLWAGGGFCGLAAADQGPVRVAVAANFAETLKRLGAEFSKQTGELPPVISSGATGLLYSQIVQGAPFDLFFAADEERPARLEAAGLIVPGSRQTYAVGKLVAWRPDRPWQGTLKEVLADRAVRVVSMANPAVAPYGVAAQQVLESLGLWASPPFRIVQGESLGQAFQFVASGNAQIGFIALSQVLESAGGRYAVDEAQILEIDPRLHAPITQDVVRLAVSADKPTAGRFLDFVLGPQGRAIIAEAGYVTAP